MADDYIRFQQLTSAVLQLHVGSLGRYELTLALNHAGCTVTRLHATTCVAELLMQHLRQWSTSQQTAVGSVYVEQMACKLFSMLR